MLTYWSSVMPGAVAKWLMLSSGAGTVGFRAKYFNKVCSLLLAKLMKDSSMPAHSLPNPQDAGLSSRAGRVPRSR